jgi:protein-serine/threonine kinase
MKPPIIPNQGKGGVDTVNFRNVKESESVDISGSRPMTLKGVPLDSGLATPGGDIADPFEDFNSVTLHHDGDEHGGHHHHVGSSFVSSPAVSIAVGGASGRGRR